MRDKKFQDLTEHTFERLKVIKRIENDKQNNSQWLCECSCGNKNLVRVTGTNLRQGRVKSCGCLEQDCGKATKNFDKMHKGKRNIYDLTGEYGVGYFFNTNNFFLFDIGDYDKIKEYCWHENNNGYAFNKSKGKLFLHRLLMNPSEKEFC